MGVLTDFVIADAGAGKAIGECADPNAQWPTLEAKGVGMIEVATLHCAITGITYHNDIVSSMVLVGGDQDEGPWVMAIPAGILQSIANLEEARTQSVAVQWSNTEELRRDGWQAGEAAEFVQQLTAHARKALQGGKALYLRISL